MRYLLAAALFFVCGAVEFVHQTWGFILSPRRSVQPLIIRPLSWNVRGQARKTVVFHRSFDRTKTKQKDDDNDGQVDNNRNEDDSLSFQSQQAASASEFVQPNGATVPLKRKARFTIPEPKPKFVWQPPKSRNVDPTLVRFVNPAAASFTCARLLMSNSFIDKSAVLYYLLDIFFDYDANDFRSVPLLVVYPRRFAKTTLLGFIEAVFSPVPWLDKFDADEIKTKISALERGKELLSFGSRPVLSIDMHGVTSVMPLNKEIAINLERAGLNEVDVNTLTTSSFSPADLLYNGVAMLNNKFKADTGIQRNTIVLIDEYDKLFRDREVDDYIEKEKDSGTVKERKRTILALLDIFVLGKKKGGTGISLFVLCGLTRMVGSGLSSMNNLVDVSRRTVFHGLCGISARELVKCAASTLDPFAKEQYGGKNFTDILEEEFIPKWKGFRFGIDKEIGPLDPNLSEGALFSPLDAWEIVQSLVNKQRVTLSLWMSTMESEFEFTSFARKFTSTPDGLVDLFQNLDGGWVDAVDLKLKMKREDYLLLKEELHIQKVLFELGLLSVQAINDNNEVLLGPPNDMVTENALKFLVQETKYRDPPKKKAQEYMSEPGFGIILSKAGKVLSNMYRGVGLNAVDESVFQFTIFREFSYRFPNKKSKNYALYKEPDVVKQSSVSDGRGHVDLAVALHYPNSPTTAFMIVLKMAKLEKGSPVSVNDSHQMKIEEATKQVLSYSWKDAVDATQKVVVSGVWHPSSAQGNFYELSIEYEFLPSSSNI